jgi:hypothetical protein
MRNQTIDDPTDGSELTEKAWGNLADYFNLGISSITLLCLILFKTKCCNRIFKRKLLNRNKKSIFRRRSTSSTEFELGVNNQFKCNSEDEL